MKKLTLLVAVATMLTSTLGCNACRNLFGGKPHVVARPVASQCGPSCGPTCNSCNNSCNNSAPTNFGGSYQGMPTGTFMSPADFSGAPMMMTSPVEMPAGQQGSGAR